MVEHGIPVQNDANIFSTIKQFLLLLFVFLATPGNVQWLFLMALKNYAFCCLWDYKGYQVLGIKPCSVVCKANAQHTVLTL